QSVQITTASLERLPKTVAAAQSVLTLNNLQFGLSPQTSVRLEEQRIAALDLDKEAVELGMQAKAEEFKSQGSELYHKV
ncbi:MAG: hypothetical protein K2Y25_00730, partial [Pseudomonadaceae bacterium]|nr:hypothetical protein [Pseudomonadaceae bacterium]